MAIYEPTVWVDNQPPYINAENLNHIEQAIRDLSEGLAGITENVLSLLEARPTVAAVTIPSGDIVTALQTAAEAIDKKADIDLSGSTYDPEDAATLRTSALAGKRLKLDLTVMTGNNLDVLAGTESVDISSGGRDIYTYMFVFETSALTGRFSFPAWGLYMKRLSIIYRYDHSGSRPVYTVTATVEAESV